MNKVYDYNKNILNLDFQNIKYNLELRDDITIINGFSASGKTLLVNIIKNMKTVSSDILFDDISNILVFTVGDTIEFTDDEILVIIDKGERVLDDDLCKKIVSCRKARFLLFTRGSHNLYCSPNHFGEFVENNNIITINYKFNVVGWG